MAGFQYNGIHSQMFGCHYAPSAAEQGRDMPAYDVEDLDIGGVDGG